jgi:hypothetical protein
MEDTKYTVYKITNKVNGRFYIGCHKTVDLDDGYMGSGKVLKRAIEKYGIENFEKEILAVFDNSEEMFKMEFELVDAYSDETYNIKEGGMGGFDYLNSEAYYNPTHDREYLKYLNELSLSPEARERHRLAVTIANRDPDRIKRRKETILKKYGLPGNCFASFEGMSHSDETKRKIGEANRIHQAGKGNSQYGTMWITDGTVSRKIKKTDVIPDGWYRGRK